MKASLPNYRQSPRKVRLVAKAVRGKSAADARLILSFMPKRAAEPIMKLIDSAVANASMNNGVNPSDLVIKNIEVNKGVVMKRYRPRARGSAYRINKRTSHILVTLASKSGAAAATAADKPVEAKPVKKVAAKKVVAKKAAKPAGSKAKKLEAKS